MECLRSRMMRMLVEHADYVISNVLVRAGENKMFFPGGHNGPYIHHETPIRNTSHFVVLLANLLKTELESEKEKCFKKHLNQLIRYLVDANPYFKKGQFIQRGLANDTCNGVIGEAWVIEALSIESDSLDADNQSNRVTILEAMSTRADFDRTYSFAYRFDCQKGKLTPDFTFNHQLWLAACLEDSKIHNKSDFVNSFLSSALNGAFQIRDNGLINHLYHGRTLKNKINKLAYKRAELTKGKKVNYKERGYHLFNLFAFSKIYAKQPNNAFFSSDNFCKSLKYVSLDVLDALSSEDNVYGSHYNVSAFELPFIYQTFACKGLIALSQEEYESYMNRELDKYWNAEHKCFCNNDVDLMTFMARVYELSYIV
ncbi:hypothetical protein L1D19_10540 [Vibrio natriegens]|uniref:hypothetical protein n=1 Tax=Vibrio natriegens TaxID=691 RepID=UPI001EFCD464|nr:hypothetical protein [Vibrio natriegens]MCG9700553.1 hypothetical protein [Vibrio natriegens]